MTGEQLKLEGIRRVANNNREWVDRMRSAATTICILRGVVTTDDLRPFIKDYGNPVHPNAWGAIFKERGWKSIGWKKSTYPSNHARMIRVWRWEENA